MFRFFPYIIGSLKFYWRTNLGVVAGSSIATAVLIGALISGDSVKSSLLKLSLKRLGMTEYALDAGEQFFRAELAQDIRGTTGTQTAALLQVSGTLQKGSLNRLNQVQVYGIDESFSQFSRSGNFPTGFESNEVAISQRVADLMDLAVGDKMILRVENNILVPLETPVASKDDRVTSISVSVKTILNDVQLGRFSLKSNQFVPNNVFISQEYLARKIGLERKANLMVAESQEQIGSLDNALGQRVRLQDLGLNLREIPESDQFELISDNIFIQESIRQAVLKSGIKSHEILSYFVNEIRIGDRSVPYSFVAGVSHGEFADLSDGEIILNDWTASELKVNPGDTIEISYYLQDSRNELIRRSRSFALKSITPLTGSGADKLLMPEFPGLGDAETCGDWNPGIPVDLDKIQERDEEYWDEYGGTPKAFISVKSAQSLWANKFGQLTALRFPVQGRELVIMKHELLNHLRPEHLGLKFEPVLEEAISATRGGVDFGQLFMGLSFFIIIAANLLTGLLFAFNAEQRYTETRQFLALGFLPEQIRKLRLTEGLFLALCGGLVGVFLGIKYAEFIMYGLGTFWRDAVGFSDFHLHIQISKLWIGMLSGVTISFLSIYLVMHRQFGDKRETIQSAGLHNRAWWIKRRKIHYSILIMFIIITLNIVLKHPPGQAEAVMKYYTAAALLLATGIHVCFLTIRELKYHGGSISFDVTGLILRNWSRRSGRNLTTVVLIALGIFIVVSVGLNHQDPTVNSDEETSGSGGFRLFVETTLPILADGIIEQTLAKSQNNDQSITGNPFVSFKKKSGDDGSCLNLNMVNQPQVLGGRSEDLSGHFTFSNSLENSDGVVEWELLDLKLEANVIPAIADMSVIQWGMDMKLGDTLHYLDDNGQTLSLVLMGGLANSIFQGNVIISENNFSKYFPRQGGSHLFLVKAVDPQAIQKQLEFSLKNYGPVISSCDERLIAFSAVENTYLSIFLMLGALGLLVGTVGLGLVILRNIIENRSEIALLQAMGFRPGAIFKIILGEQLLTLLTGLLVGGGAALIAILPLLNSGSQEGLKLLGGIVGVMLINGVLWSAMAVRFAFSEEIARPLNEE